MTDDSSAQRVTPKKRKIKRLRLEDDLDQEDVGYGKPPRASQFKPGTSGNPKGRPRGSKNESTILREMLNEKLSLRQPNGRVKKIPALEGVHRKQLERALKGDVKSAAFVLNRYAALVSGELQIDDLGDDEQAVLDAFARRLQGIKQWQ